MEDNFLDLTVTSPPYDNLRSYKNGIGDSWGEHVWKPVIKELYRVTKEGGVVVWVVGDATIKGSETGTSFRQALYFMECGFRLHDTMIFTSEKPPLTHRRYEQKFEYMFIFSKSSPKTFNPMKIPSKTAGKSRKHNKLRQDSDELSDRSTRGVVKNYKMKGNVWNIPTGGNTADSIAFKHPAVFPEQLANDHIISWSNEGDVVYDCFAGSGTCAKMSILNNRNYIGSEISSDYCKIIETRIEEIE